MRCLVKYLVVGYFSLFMIGCKECVCPVSSNEVVGPVMVDIVVSRGSFSSFEDRTDIKVFNRGVLIDVVPQYQIDTLTVEDSTEIKIEYNYTTRNKRVAYSAIAFNGMVWDIDYKYEEQPEVK